MDSLITPSENGSYTRIKQISHIPLTIQALLKEYIHGGIEKQAFEMEIQRLLLDMKAILNDLDLIFGHNDCTTQRCILMDLISLLPEHLNVGSAQAAYKHYQMELNKLKPLLEKNIEAAARAQVLEIHHQIASWKLQDKEMLKHLRILIVGPHGPRSGRVDMQYFIALYQQIGNIPSHEVKNNYLYHIEMLPSQMRHVDIEKDLIQGFLMESEYNKSVGKVMLNNRYAMFRDILERAGTKAIHEILGTLKEHGLHKIESKL